MGITNTMQFIRKNMQCIALLCIAAASTMSHAEPQHGGTLVAVIQPEPTALTSVLSTSNPSMVVSSNIFDGLLSYDAKHHPQPALATSWEASSNGKKITFHLRRGVKWHDGVEFTSADVQFSALELWKKIHGRGRSTFSELTAVDTPDRYTAILYFSSPAPAVLSALSVAESQVLPRHLYEGTDVQSNPYNIKPVGTGPFRFKIWKKGEFIELERNPDYWDSGKPYLDRIIFRSIPDEAARAVAFERNDVQYGVNTPVPLSDVQRLRKLPNLVIDNRGYGWASNYLLVELNLRNQYLQNIKVRQAIAHAINKQALIDTAWYGFGKPAISPIATSLPAFHTDKVTTYAFDIALANRLLDEAGFKRNPQGARFSLKGTYLPFGEAYRASAEYIRQSLKQVGISVVINSYDMATYVRTVYDSYDYDINLLQLAPLTDPQIGLHRTIWSKAATKGVPFVNATGYASAEADAAIEASRKEIDPKKRQQQFYNIQRIVTRDLPIIPLVELEQFTIYGKQVKDVPTRFDGQISSLKDVWLDR